MNAHDELAITLDPRLAQRLAKLTPARRLFVEREMRAVRLADNFSVIPPRSEVGPAPLSFSQEVMWHIEQSAPGLPTYNTKVAMRIAGPLDLELLRSALTTLVVRHEALRTNVESLAGEPRAVVNPPRPPSLKVVDLCSWVPHDREDKLGQVLKRAAIEPFDLASDLLLRATVVVLGVEDHALALVSHHFASDESSARILLGDLAALYNGLRAGESVELPATALKYADFSTWQRAYWRGSRLDELVSLWQTQLAAAPERLELPLDRRRPAFPNFAGERLTYRFSAALARAVVKLGAAHGATSFVTLLAAFQTLLHRYNGQDDVYVGSVFSGRGHGELGNVLGYFSNVLPLGAHFASDPTFIELLAQVREAHIFALDHSEVPFEKLAAEIGARFQTGRVGTFSALFTTQADGPAIPLLDGLWLTPITIEDRTAKLDLAVGIEVRQDALNLSVEYRTQLFDGSTIDRLFENFETLLKGIVSDPSQRVSRLPLLGSTELRLVASPDTTSAPFRANATVVDLLREQAGRTPAAIAIECGTDSLTYEQLDERANQLGSYLRTRGVGPEVIVAVCVERSIDMVVAVLGVQRAGGAYVPIDPNLPRSRIAFMLADAAPALVVTCDALRDRLLTDGPMLSLDAERDAIQSAQPMDPDLVTEPRQLACVIYTLATTGRPQGVQIEHRNLFNLVNAMQSVVGVQPGDALVAVNSLSFDPWSEEIYLSLAHGARVIIAPHAATVDSKALAALYERVKPTIATAPPAIWRMLIEAGWQGSRGLRIYCGGAALPQKLAEQLLDRVDEVWNVYGQTEATTVSTLARIERGAAISIGTPLPNVNAYILDKHLQPLPARVQGELYIGGQGVGRGYLNRPELTAERFVPDPFGAQPEARLYRTGDLARRRTDGSIDYLGRLDQQVELRGFRIELGEIENALREHLTVRDAAVLVLPNDSGEPTLVAYYVVRPGEFGELAASLRAHLLGLLPRYMIPTHFVALDALPLSSSGKLDRIELAQRGLAAAVTAGTFVAPGTPTEERMQQIWSQVMQCERLGIEDSFFDLGGQSILALRIVSRVREEFGVRVPLVAMYDLPTIKALARFVDEATSPPGTLSVPNLPRAPGPIRSDEPPAIMNNPLHHQLLGIWMELLGARPIGIRDNFLQMGGNSTLATRLIALVENATGKTVPVVRFLENPTIAHLASLILENRDVQARFPLMALNPAGSRPPFFFAHSDLNGAGFYTRKFGRRLGPDQPFYVLAPHGSDGRPCPPTIEEMAREYVAVIRSARPDGPYILGGFCSGGLVVLEMARRLRLEGVEVSNVILLDVPSVNASLGGIASAIDFIGASLRADDSFRLFLCSALGNAVAWAVRRSASLRGAAGLARAGGIRAIARRLVAGPLEQDWVQEDYPWLEPFWRSVARSHIPRPYGGRITLLASEQQRTIGESTILRRWRAISHQLSLHPIPGRHLECITLFADETAARIAQVLEGEGQLSVPKEPA